MKEIGYDSIDSFMDSLIHPNQIGVTSTTSVVATGLAYYFETYVGIAPAVGMAIFVLFFLEMFTGIKASRREGKGFNSRKFGSGCIKMGVYIMIISVMHVVSQYITPKPLFGWEFNIYEWLHYFFLNFVILQMVISNLENFERLGWDAMVPAVKKINSLLGIKPKRKK